MRDLGVSSTGIPKRNLSLSAFSRLGNSRIAQIAFRVLLLTLLGIATDQFAVPILYSSSPLWATGGCLLLIWRRGEVPSDPDASPNGSRLSPRRIVLFGSAHLVLVLTTRAFQGSLQPVAGTVSNAGWLVAAFKLSVFLPTLLLLPLARWRILHRPYVAEGMASLIVLFTFFPGRIITALWPWYGQLLGRFVFLLARLFVPSLVYVKALTPTLYGPDLDVTILLGCSGINGIELFDYLFAFMAFLDWNRLRKRRTFLAYFAGIAAMFFGNALRITSLVVLGNRGFADVVARFHISAGWIFFSVIFLVYLSLTYRSLLSRPATN